MENKTITHLKFGRRRANRFAPLLGRFESLGDLSISAFPLCHPGSSNLIVPNQGESNPARRPGPVTTVSPDDRLASSSSCHSAFSTPRSPFGRIVLPTPLAHPSWRHHVRATRCISVHSVFTIPDSAFPKSTPHSTKQHILAQLTQPLRGVQLSAFPVCHPSPSNLIQPYPSPSYGQPSTINRCQPW